MNNGIIDREAVDRIVETAMKSWKVPGASVAVVMGDDEYVQGYGVRELDKPETVTPQTLFAIASMSKAFTSTAMAMLVDEGKMSWDDHPRRYVPYFRLSDPAADSMVTMRDLLCHRTGMPRHDALWYAADYTIEEIIRRFGIAPSAHPFRAKYDYSNIPFYVVGEAIGAASGSTWEDFISERIFKPIGMTGASSRFWTLKKSPDHASGHVKYKGKVVVPNTRDYRNIGPGGGIIAGAADMLNWLRFHLNNGEYNGERIVSRENLAETKKPQMVVPWDNPDKHGLDQCTELMTYCMGWHKLDYRGEIILSHGGWVSGFTGSLNLFPRLNAGFVILTNLASGSSTPVLRNSLRDEIMGLPKKNWNTAFKAYDKAIEKEQKENKAKEVRHKRTRASRSLEAYAGDYENSTYGPLTISKQDDLLILTFGFVSYKLKHFHYDTFIGKHEKPEEWDDLKVIFNLGPDGEIDSVKTLAAWPEIEFKRVKNEQVS